MSDNLIYYHSGGDIYRYPGMTTPLTDSLSGTGLMGYCGIAWYQDGLITIKYTDKFIKYVGFSLTISDCFSSPSSDPRGVEWTGRDLLSSDCVSDKIYKHSGFSNSIVTSFSSPGSYPRGLCWDYDNETLYSTDYGGRFNKHLGFSSTISDYITVGSLPGYYNPNDLAWYDGVLYASPDELTYPDTIYKISGFSSTITDSFVDETLNTAWGVTWEHNGFPLPINDAYHLHVPDAITLTQTHNLSNLDAYSLHIPDGIALTQVHDLVVNESNHIHVSDNINMNFLYVDYDNDHLHVADNVNLIVPLLVNESDHLHVADNISPLVQIYTLEIQEAYHLFSNMGAIPPVLQAESTYHVFDSPEIELFSVDANGAVTLPYPTLDATLGQYEGVAVTLPSLSMTANTGGICAIDLPVLDFSGEADTGILAASDLTLPMIDVSITLGANSLITIPSLVTSASSVIGNIVSSLMTIPMFSLSSTSTVNQDGNIDVSLPIVQINATTLTGVLSNDAVTLPSLTCEISAQNGILATSDLDLPSFTIDGESVSNMTSDGEMTLPAFMIDAHAKTFARFEDYIMRYTR